VLVNLSRDRHRRTGRRVVEASWSGRRVSAPVVDNVYSLRVSPHATELFVRTKDVRSVRITFTGE
jgi:hypothetical protein